MSYLRVVGAGYVVGITHTMQTHLVHHVRLTRTHPNIANQNFLQRDLIAATDVHRIGATGPHRRQYDNPFAIGRGLRLVCLAVEPDINLFATRGPSPHIYPCISLQDHTIPYQLWQSYLRLTTINQAKQCDYYDDGPHVVQLIYLYAVIG